MNRELEPLDRVVSPIRFAHIVLRTKRLSELVSWYETVLGARVAFRNDFISFLTYDDEHHRLALVQSPSFADAPENGVGLEHFAYTFATLGDLLQTWKRLQGKGIAPFWCINHGPTTSMYFRDPEGNRVELQVDNFPDTASLNAWFQSGAFAKNPIGVVFDPEKLLARWQNGDPESELIRQGSAS
jgi:catechol-2,3-dioxygenase